MRGYLVISFLLRFKKKWNEKTC